MLFWWPLLHFGAWYDALNLEDLWLWCTTLGGWWHGDFDDGGLALVMIWLLWLMTWRLCLVGDLVDGGFATLMIWRQFLFYILPASWSLPPLRVGFLKPLLVGSKRTLVGSSRRVGTLISVGVEWSEKIEVFRITTTIVSNGFYQWIMIEFSIYIWCTLSTWFIYCYALKINNVAYVV